MPAVVEPPKTPAQTEEEILAKALSNWERIPPPKTKAKQCKFCGNWYLMPCTEENHGRCSNYLWLKDRKDKELVLQSKMNGKV